MYMYVSGLSELEKMINLTRIITSQIAMRKLRGERREERIEWKSKMEEEERNDYGTSGGIGSAQI